MDELIKLLRPCEFCLKRKTGQADRQDLGCVSHRHRHVLHLIKVIMYLSYYLPTYLIQVLVIIIMET